MTKQEFLSGKTFTFSLHNGRNTFQYVSPFGGIGEGSIQRNIISLDEEKVILTDYEANVSKLGSKTFTVYTYVLDKKVQLKYRYDELI